MTEMTMIIKSEDGQGMVEYGLILLLVAIGSLVALSSLGNNSVMTMYEQVLKIVEVLGA